VGDTSSIQADERTPLISPDTAKNAVDSSDAPSPAGEVPVPPEEKKCCGYLRRLSDSFRMMFRRREGDGRCHLLALFGAISLQVG